MGRWRYIEKPLQVERGETRLNEMKRKTDSNTDFSEQTDITARDRENIIPRNKEIGS